MRSTTKLTIERFKALLVTMIGIDVMNLPILAPHGHTKSIEREFLRALRNNQYNTVTWSDFNAESVSWEDVADSTIISWVRSIQKASISADREAGRTSLIDEFNTKTTYELSMDDREFISRALEEIGNRIINTSSKLSPGKVAKLSSTASSTLSAPKESQQVTSNYI
jgi:hypothetical protein